MKSSKIFLSVLLLSFMTSFIMADNIDGELHISIDGNQYGFIDPNNVSKFNWKLPVYYYAPERGKKHLTAIITNVSNQNMILVAASMYFELFLISEKMNTYGKKGGLGISSTITPPAEILLKKNDSLIHHFNIDNIKLPPVAHTGHGKTITVQARFSIPNIVLNKFPKKTIAQNNIWTGTVISEPKEMIIRNVSGIHGTKRPEKIKPLKIDIQSNGEHTEQLKNIPQQSTPKKLTKFIKPDIKEAIADTEIGHIEFEDASLNAIVMLLSEKFKGNIKIINTLSEEQQNKIKPISFKADDISLKKVLSLICKKTGLKYVIGKDAVYIGY